MDVWVQFFLRAGIPDGVANRYAKSFQSNRITREMLPDLDKETLSELGITAIGDQLAILRRIKDAGSSLTAPRAAPSHTGNVRSRVVAPGRQEVSSTASEARRGRPPPDRHEIYHIKMPEGNTRRSQKILKKAEFMRMKGVAVRGTTGVRQGGRSVSPIDKTSAAARIRREAGLAAEVSSSSDGLVKRLGVRGMHSDAISGGSIHRVETVKRNRIQKVGRVAGGLASRAFATMGDVPNIQNRHQTTQKNRDLKTRITIRQAPDDEIVVDPRRATVRRVGISNANVFVGDDDEDMEYYEDDDGGEYVEEEEEDEMEEYDVVEEQPVNVRQRVSRVHPNDRRRGGRAVVVGNSSVFSRISRITYR